MKRAGHPDPANTWYVNRDEEIDVDDEIAKLAIESGLFEEIKSKKTKEKKEK